MSGPRPSAELTGRLQAGGSVVCLTGAGVSAESGLATFRGPGGLWEGHDPTSLATPEAFRADALMVWRFYAWRRAQAAAADPNPGHLALAEMESLLADFVLVTQNVDGLHEQAGNQRLLRLHGSLWRLRCTRSGKETDDLRADLEPLPPRCPCGGLLRPSVVWFGEPLPEDVLAQAERAARQSSVFIVAGTEAAVYPAAALPVLARASGSYVVEINPARTSLSDRVDERLAGPSGEVIPLLAEAVRASSAGG